MLGACLCGVYIVSFAISTILQLTWAWVDDGKVDSNWIKGATMKLWGYSLKSSWSGITYKNKGGSSSCGEGPILLTTGLLAVAPIAILGALTYWQAAAIVALALACTFGARFVRRLSKRFGIHVKDKEVHNVSK